MTKVLREIAVVCAVFGVVGFFAGDDAATVATGCYLYCRFAIAAIRTLD